MTKLVETKDLFEKSCPESSSDFMVTHIKDNRDGKEWVTISYFSEGHYCSEMKLSKEEALIILNAFEKNS